MAEEGRGIDKFNGKDFAFWIMQIEDYLYMKKMHLPLLCTNPKNMKDDEQALLDRQALGSICLSLSRSVAFNMVNETTTVGIMPVLSSMYDKPSANKKV